MTRHVHFVGSIGLDSAEDVFDAIGATVKDHVHRCPDGEIGVRRLWISYQWPLLRATSFLSPASDTAIPGTRFDWASNSAWTLARGISRKTPHRSRSGREPLKTTISTSMRV